MKYDILLKNGHVIDPGNEIDAVMDVAVKDGRIAAVAAELNAADAAKVIDLSGLYVTPGLIDNHVHCYYTGGAAKAWAGDFSLQPDYFNFPGGVTTLVDAGSAGSYNFDHFRASVIERCKTKVFAVLNAANYGMASLEGEQFPEKNDKEAYLRCYEKNRDILRGIKIAHYWADDWKQLEQAQELQQELDAPIMVDFGNFRPSRPYDELVTEKLRPGDITTHCFRAPVPVVDENGKVYDYLWKAKERGVWFDLGHGCESFAFRNAVPAMRQGFIPDCFSSDLHALDVNSTLVDMANLLSKLMACCEMPLIEVFRRVTENPAKMLKLDGCGYLNVGDDADIAVWSIRDGDFRFRDGAGYLMGKQRLECEMTFRAGEVVWDFNARSIAQCYDELPSDYGIKLPDVRVTPKN